MFTNYYSIMIQFTGDAPQGYDNNLYTIDEATSMVDKLKSRNSNIRVYYQFATRF